jgi:uncharacterized Ntn-hydrolase superfamily protein
MMAGAGNTHFTLYCTLLAAHHQVVGNVMASNRCKAAVVDTFVLMQAWLCSKLPHLLPAGS